MIHANQVPLALRPQVAGCAPGGAPRKGPSYRPEHFAGVPALPDEIVLRLQHGQHLPLAIEREADAAIAAAKAALFERDCAEKRAAAPPDRSQHYDVRKMVRQRLRLFEREEKRLAARRAKLAR